MAMYEEWEFCTGNWYRDGDDGAMEEWGIVLWCKWEL